MLTETKNPPSRACVPFLPRLLECAYGAGGNIVLSRASERPTRNAFNRPTRREDIYMERRVILYILVSVFIGMTACSSAFPTKIHTILSNPRDYSNKQVTISG